MIPGKTGTHDDTSPKIHGRKQQKRRQRFLTEGNEGNKERRGWLRLLFVTFVAFCSKFGLLSFSWGNRRSHRHSCQRSIL
jgi:hypothetical protein